MPSPLFVPALSLILKTTTVDGSFIILNPSPLSMTFKNSLSTSTYTTLLTNSFVEAKSRIILSPSFFLSYS